MPRGRIACGILVVPRTAASAKSPGETEVGTRIASLSGGGIAEESHGRREG